MSTRTFALIFGITFLIIGAGGFIPGLYTPLHDGHPDVVGNPVQALGLFPANELHHVVHILFGIWGLAASRSLSASVMYGRGVAIIYAVLMVMGLIPPPVNTTFGLVPLYGNDVWLHAVLALIGAYFGWVHRNPTNA